MREGPLFGEGADQVPVIGECAGSSAGPRKLKSLFHKWLSVVFQAVSLTREGQNRTTHNLWL